MSGRQSPVAPSVELLLATHVFPGEYIVKAFGPGDDGFRAAVLAAAAAVVGVDRIRSSERASRQGRKMCITVTVSAETVDDVVRVYDQIGLVPELLMLL
jgi:putative lipoic acid-binding regulatory protein